MGAASMIGSARAASHRDRALQGGRCSAPKFRRVTPQARHHQDPQARRSAVRLP